MAQHTVRDSSGNLIGETGSAEMAKHLEAAVLAQAAHQAQTTGNPAQTFTSGVEDRPQTPVADGLNK